MVDVSKIAKMKWEGSWIWANYIVSRERNSLTGLSDHETPILPEELNKYCLARKVFEVNKNLKSAVINISADSRYKLFINGKYIGRGINRCESLYWYYNTYNITEYLTEGKNVIAISARYYGRDFAYYTKVGGTGRRKENSGKGGILFEVELNYDNNTEWLGSDKETKITLNEGEKSKLPLKNDAMGFMEEFDSRKTPKNWNELEFDDSNWKQPIVLDYPIKTLLFDENHPLDEKVYYPSEILKIGENNDINYDEEYDDEDREEMDYCIQHMLEGHIESLKSFDIKNQENLLNGNKIVEIIPREEAKGKVLSIFLKFSKEMVGYPQIYVEGEEGVIIDIIPTEKITNNLPALDFMVTKRGSRVILRGGLQFFEQWDWEGYLYMLIKIRNLSKPFKIHRIVTNQTHMKITQKGYFRSNEPELEKLWEACAHTVLCCAIDGYLDCPSREQRAYLGDAYPEALIANACFGEPRLTKKLIYDTAFGQRKDGITYSFHPGDAIGQNHIIPDYCLYWIQIAQDYYQYYGDEEALENLYHHFVQAIEWFWKYIDPESGLLTDLPYWTFIDWSFSHDKPGKWAILNTQFMDVLFFMAELSEKYGSKKKTKQYRDKAEDLMKKIDELFWDPKEGCYRDFYHEGKLQQFSYMTNSYLVLKGITSDAKKISSIMNRIFEYEGSDDMIKKQIDDYYLKNMSHHVFGLKLKEMVVVAQPFFQHQVHKFFSKIGRYDLILKFIKKWLPMLELGKTQTIWETWSIAGSECHAWAATPAYDLSTYWLGVKPSKPGFDSVEISPTFYGLNNVDGMFPTCKGEILVKWSRENNSVNIEIKLPDLISEGMFIIPELDGKSVTKVETNNIKESGMDNCYKLNPSINKFKIYY